VRSDKQNFILNGDYSAATDHLKLSVVHCIALILIARIQAEIKTISSCSQKSMLSLWCDLVYTELLAT